MTPRNAHLYGDGMKTNPTSFRDIIDMWKSRLDLEADLSEYGVTRNTIAKWYERDSIPSRFWVGLTHAARRRRLIGATIARLAMIDADKKVTQSGIDRVAEG